MHLLHLGNDFLSYDNESTRAALNSGAPGVPGVAGADTFGVAPPVSMSGIGLVSFFFMGFFLFLVFGVFFLEGGN
jgi:hypothetical protein